MSVEQPAVRGDSQVETFASVLAAVGEGAILALAAGEIQPDPTSFADDGYDAAGEHSRTAPDKRTIVGIGLNVATAVERLWAKRIVHRDIKPANIVKAATDRFVLVDVGLARHLDRSALTAPGAAPCTPGYASPEQALGRRNLTINSDVFSLGVTLYEIGTGIHPFNRAQNLVGVISPRPIQLIRRDLDGPLAALISQMMAVSPAARPSAIRSRFEQVP